MFITGICHCQSETLLGAALNKSCFYLPMISVYLNIVFQEQVAVFQIVLKCG